MAIPVRVRSHFDAQDVLENGAATLRRQEDGWLNRAIVAAGGTSLKGLSIGAQTPLILRGDRRGDIPAAENLPVGNHVDVAPAGLVQVVATRGGGVGDLAFTDHGTVTDDHARSPFVFVR